LGLYERGEGFPVVLCHGFPELAYSWRHQLPAVAAAGFRAIAPDQRGYGATDAPDAVESYDIHHLTDDLAGMLDALELERAVFCGHDWGGMVVWQLALLHPDRVAGVIGVNTPFLPRPPQRPLDMLRSTFGDGHYIVYFQKPGVADERLARDVERSFEMFMRKGVKLEEYLRRSAEQGTLNFEAGFEQRELPGEPLLEPHELAVFVETFRKTGFTGGINWYRNLDRNWETTADLASRVEVPALIITAEDDVALPPALAEGMEAHVPDLERHLVRDCGHWTQQEHPDEVNRVMVDWLRRRFG
jgi:pimeloyl-ACP methyl ester carboxylesterase